MSQIPEHMLTSRKRISEQFIRGSGIEIGALHYPLHVSNQTNVKYVDRLPVEELKRQYPELSNTKLVDVDIIDDGETLITLRDSCLDFLIANHMLEHCENPLGAIRNHLSKIKRGGFLYYAIPDKMHSFDVERPLTTFEHLVRDDRGGVATSRDTHFLEWARFVNKLENENEVSEQAAKLEKINYSIHFHVWDMESFFNFVCCSQSYLDESFRVLHFERNDTEIITILQKI